MGVELRKNLFWMLCLQRSLLRFRSKFRYSNCTTIEALFSQCLLVGLLEILDSCLFLKSSSRIGQRNKGTFSTYFSCRKHPLHPKLSWCLKAWVNPGVWHFICKISWFWWEKNKERNSNFLISGSFLLRTLKHSISSDCKIELPLQLFSEYWKLHMGAEAIYCYCWQL